MSFVEGFDGRAFDSWLTTDPREADLCAECGCDAREPGGPYCGDCRLYVRARIAREWLARTRGRINPDPLEQSQAREEYRAAFALLDRYGRFAVTHRDRCGKRGRCTECRQLRSVS